MNTPNSLSVGGRELWAGITESHDLDAGQLAQLEEACREKDRCDALDQLMGEADDPKIYLSLVSKANETANQMKQMLAALRLPDEVTGKKPQRRSARGAYSKGTKVSSLERARAAKSS